jgi:transcriptional regulator PpsR
VPSLATTRPDVTLLLDRDGVIREVTLCEAAVGEEIQPWLGRPWAETLSSLAADQVRRFLDDATQAGVCAFGPVTQTFPSGLELPMEYTAVRLGRRGSLLAVGKSAQAVVTLRSRLLAAQRGREQDYWRLREVETRYRLLFDATNDAVVLLEAETLRIADANPAALRAFGAGKGHELLADLPPNDRAAVLGLLQRARDTGRVPGILVHIGPAAGAWTLRASHIQTGLGAGFLLQFARVGAEAAGLDSNPLLAADAYAERLACLPAVARIGAVPLNALVQEATEAVERQCIVSALERCAGNRSATAALLGLSRQSLYVKLSRYGLHRAGETDPGAGQYV